MFIRKSRSILFCKIAGTPANIDRHQCSSKMFYCLYATCKLKNIARNWFSGVNLLFLVFLRNSNYFCGEIRFEQKSNESICYFSISSSSHYPLTFWSRPSAGLEISSMCIYCLIEIVDTRNILVRRVQRKRWRHYTAPKYMAFDWRYWKLKNLAANNENAQTLTM